MKRINDTTISINGKQILIVPSAKDAKDIVNLPWKDLDIDIVLDTTGKFTKHEDLNNHIIAGAKKVVLSAPGKGDKFKTATFVPGVNSQDYKADIDVISAASCTTNGLTPALKVLQDVFGIDAASFTTTHSVTASQYVLDKRAKKPERGRATKNT